MQKHFHCVRTPKLEAIDSSEAVVSRSTDCAVSKDLGSWRRPCASGVAQPDAILFFRQRYPVLVKEWLYHDDCDDMACVLM
jgi:hypothetical protein